MAIDGPKIIASDLGHDTYWSIMDLYDTNVDFEKISNEIPFIYTHDDEIDYEIFVTSYALAFWEIGQISPEILREVRSVIDKGVFVKKLSEEFSEKDGKVRQKELDKFWMKISQPNTKIRPRKKYHQITRFHFQTDTLLAFKLDDKLYRAAIFIEIRQYRGRCEYAFLPTTFIDAEKPSISSILNAKVIGTSIGADKEFAIQTQPGIEKLWHLYSYFGPFVFGAMYLVVEHKSLRHFKDQFEIIGSLKIQTGFKQYGIIRYAHDFKDFGIAFNDIEEYVGQSTYKKFPLMDVLDIP